MENLEIKNDLRRNKPRPVIAARRAETFVKPETTQHEKFLVGYSDGNLGCGVNTSKVVSLFFAGKISSKIISSSLSLWLVGLFLLVALCVVGFLNLPLGWALAGVLVVSTFYLLAFFQCVGQLVLSLALANKEFFDFTLEKRALVIIRNDY
jgi:hypothetical protein